MTTMLQRMVLVAGIVTTMGAPVRAAEDDAAPSGSANLDQETCIEDRTGADCVMNFEFSGESAKILFKRMPNKAVYDECTEGMMKSNNAGLRCFKLEGGKYECDFGYHFGKRAFSASQISC
jgi:hypothetical protein